MIMGDRYISYKKCPKCGEQYEVYDAPSSMMYVAKCDKCGFKEDFSYCELNGILYLLPTAIKNEIDKVGKKAFSIGKNITRDERYVYLEMWYRAAKNNSCVSHCYDDYDVGIVRGIEMILDMMGITKSDRDAYYNNHR